MVVLKAESKSSLVSDGNGVRQIEAHVVKPVDATGVGDCCAGALLVRALPRAMRCLRRHVQPISRRR